ncbi:hypothetical protein CAC42_7880 [Sphaceloma murrayae]|uniref:NAD(P)-binding domain-containing protein n=1 Tax=Sphaceloma murrayae TaxID=2082308 RepID=A0A2K1QYB7_9PEZI|nr:hypothetical protein CAC42_7880 [Sphaceloma murrayae]
MNQGSIFKFIISSVHELEAAHKSQPVNPIPFHSFLLLHSPHRSIFTTPTSKSFFPNTKKMKVLLIGATGNLGSRLIPALLTHSHSLVVYVRTPSKLSTLLAPSVLSRITVIQGDATDPVAIKQALLDNKCDALVTTAGVSAIAPWGKSDFPRIFRAVVEGAAAAGSERGRPLRAWLLGGIPLFPEHIPNLALLRSLPGSALEWSLLCPSALKPQGTTMEVPTTTWTTGRLIGGATSPPLWTRHWFDAIPFLGNLVSAGMNAGRYVTTLERCAEFIAGDLELGTGEWVGKAVGVIEEGK